MDYLLDTNFLIGLWRKPQAGPEVRFLQAHGDCVLALPWIAKGEFLAGAVIAGHGAARVQQFLATYPLTLPSDSTLAVYARLYLALHESRAAVGINDIWIAASAIEHKLPLLTRNVREFKRVEGLDVVDYAAQ
ncbi:MAG TPA: type II toxin-antitoxin system VapC family toxin [Rudaea sp.]|nr:type II toxin-antitoxin system VapC family toxin [Rudaea sp.]